MKPGMQRDILVAHWLLFDEFDIGDDCPQPSPTDPDASTPPRSSAANSQRPQNPKTDRSA
jgi:hypothetical protein